MKKTNTEPSTTEFYSGLAASLREKFNKQFNAYHRKYLQKKMKCYEVGASGASPATPEEYYACIEITEM